MDSGSLSGFSYAQSYCFTVHVKSSMTLLQRLHVLLPLHINSLSV